VATLAEGSSVEVVLDAPTARLAELEAVVERGLATFIECGLALEEIRDQGLHRATHETFKSYLEERWQFSAAWAYGQMYAARCAEAITTAYELPPGLSADAMRPLVPLLNRHGVGAVVAAWAPISERYGDRQRAPSRAEVRAALVEQGRPTTAAAKPKPIQLATIEAGLVAAQERVTALVGRLADAPLSPRQRQRAARCAELARHLVGGLEALADATEARAALEALEPSPVGVPCLQHGRLRDPATGLCRVCKRPDVNGG